MEPVKCVTENEMSLIGVENSHVFSRIWDSAPSWALFSSPVSVPELSATLIVPKGIVQTVNTVDIW